MSKLLASPSPDQEQIQRLVNEQRVILNTVQIGIGYVKNRKFQWVNAAFLSMFGYESYDLLKGLDASVIYADMKDYLRVGQEGYKQLAAGAVYTTEVKMKRKNGSVFWCSIKGQAIDPSACQEGSIWTTQDITERKENEDALRIKSEQIHQLVSEQRSILHTIRMGLCLLKNRKLQWFNPAWHQLFGYQNVEEVVGHDTLMYYQNPEDYQRIGTEAYAVLAKGGVYTTECLMKRKDGSTLWCSITGHAVDPQTSSDESIWVLQDITERKQNEDALRASNERIGQLLKEQRLILNTIRMGISYVKNRKLQWVNPAWLQLFGYESLDEWIGQETSTLYVNQEDFRRVSEESRTPLTNGEVYATECLMKRTDDSIFWCRVTGQAIDPNHLETGAIWVLQDITERKQSEDALKASTDRINHLLSEQRLILNTIRMGIIYVKDRILQWVNPGWLQMFGYKQPDEWFGRSTSMLYLSQKDFQQAGDDAYPRLALGEVYTVEILMKRKDDSLIWCSLTGQAIDPDNLEAGAIWVFQDITERKESEVLIKGNEERFQRLIQNSNDVIMVLDEHGIQRSINGPYERLTGFKVEEALGMLGFDWVHPEDRVEVQEIFKDLVSHPSDTHRAEYRSRRKDGTWIPVEAIGTNLLVDPLVKGVVINIRDISERKRLENQLQQATKMEAIGRLAGGVAHDFNNLLTIILGNLELARLDLATSDPIHNHLNEIAKATGSATTLIRQLLTFSRKEIIKPVVLNLNDLIRNMQRMVVRLIGEDIQLQTNLAVDLGSVKMDPGQLEQVLVNLTVNARDAMPNGGRLLIETANVDLDENFLFHHPEIQSEQCIVLTIQDNGQGMDEETQGHIFEPFFTTKAIGKGTGLGLATIFGIVRQSGGSIQVHSEVGQGTTFEIYLPRMDVQAVKLPRQDLLQELPRGKETILLVEDEASMRALSATSLNRLGYKVLDAPNGGEAFMLAEKTDEHIHLLLTDVIMPGMNGRELSERLLKLHPEMRVLFTSGYTEDIVVRHGVMEGHLNFLPKPHTLMDLAKKIREVLDQDTH